VTLHKNSNYKKIGYAEKGVSTCGTYRVALLPGDKSWMRKGPDSDYDDYDKRNLSVIIYDTDTP
jgi:hypothetical protein